MTPKRRREIGQAAARAYCKILSVPEVNEMTNEEITYFMTVLLKKVALDVEEYLAYDLAAKEEENSETNITAYHYEGEE